MKKKRLINAAVTIPTLALLCYGLVRLVQFLEVWIKIVEKSDLLVFVASCLWLAAGFGVLIGGIAILSCLRDGGGILWRFVESGQWLEDRGGEVVHFFVNDDLVWRFDQIFKGRKLRRPQPW